MLPRVARTSLISLVGVVCAVVLGCGDREDNETRLFLDRVARVHIDAPTAERRRHLEALEALTLSTESLDELRDLCVQGHAALIEAEEERESASRQLGEAMRRLEELQRADPDAELPEEEGEPIEQAILRSSAAVERAQGKLSECQERVASLEREHGG